MEERLVDLIVDTIKEECSRTFGPDSFSRFNNGGTSSSGKIGFFLQKPFIHSYGKYQTKRVLVTERDIRKIIKEKKNKLSIPANAIITPLAQELIEEKRIIVEKK